MWKALLWGGLAGSAVLIGALIGMYLKISKRIVGYIMAAGTGVLIGAATFELLDQSYKTGGMAATSIGFITGAVVFTVFNIIIASRGGNERKRSRENPAGHSGLAIFIGTLIDAIPESTIIGISMIESKGINWLLITAIFISNLPEGLSSSIGLIKDGYQHYKILILWLTVLLLSALSSLAGYYLLADESGFIYALINSFAAGGVVSMVSSTMMPEAYEEGGPAVGFFSALGLIVSQLLNSLE